MNECIGKISYWIANIKFRSSHRSLFVFRPTAKAPQPKENFPNTPTSPTKDNVPGRKEPQPGETNGLGIGPSPNALGTGPNGIGSRPNNAPPQLQAGQPGIGPNIRPPGPGRKPPRGGFGFFPSLPNLAELFGL